jgi:hypothetical protein
MPQQPFGFSSLSMFLSVDFVESEGNGMLRFHDGLLLLDASKFYRPTKRR